MPQKLAVELAVASMLAFTEPFGKSSVVRFEHSLTTWYSLGVPCVVVAAGVYVGIYVFQGYQDELRLRIEEYVDFIYLDKHR